MFGKFNFMVDNRMRLFPRKRIQTYFFCQRVLFNHFRSVRKGNTKLTSLLYNNIRPGLFLQTTQSVSLMDTQAIGKANNNTVLF